MTRYLKKSKLTFLLFFLIFQYNHAQIFDSIGKKTEGPPSKDFIIQDSTRLDQNPLEEYSESYYMVNQLNEAIGYPPEKFNLTTPQATLEHFIVKSRNKNFKDAAYALNLNLLPNNISLEDAAILAEKLYFIMDQRIGIAWDGISDRPDGQVDISTSTNKAIAGKPRRSINFGQIEMDDRDVVFRVQRLKYKDRGPVWLISSQTVENIEPLYEVYGPRELDKIIPSWIGFKLFDVPFWKFVGTFILLFLSWLVARGVAFILRKVFLNSKTHWVHNIANTLSSPAGAAVGILFFYILLNNLISFSGPLARGIYAVLLMAVIGTFTWLIMRVIDYTMDFFTNKKIGDISFEENKQSRKMLTYVSVGRRLFIFVIFIIAVSTIISQFPSLEKVGISLMASAGIATVIVGIAAQSTLGNIIAGVQIALTRPVKIGDAVIIKDTYGYVEDLRFTYMVVRTWDLRRKVIPLTEVISESFDNLSMTDSESLLEIEVHADYRIDVTKLRRKFIELVKNSEDWNGKTEPTVQVEGMNDTTLHIRCLCPGKDYLTAWNLHCEVREKLMAYIAELEDGIYLSRKRIDLRKSGNQDDNIQN
ncbi:mechanosensitive ion channel family protein [Christiangramia aquimixticola]|uniref:mechanosensitive ion channel family protein n=1 Tax=Christiangramia aquimixticola TaxID=1697558 RepID=UPI003AA97E98